MSAATYSVVLMYFKQRRDGLSIDVKALLNDLLLQFLSSFLVLLSHFFLSKFNYSIFKDILRF